MKKNSYAALGWATWLIGKRVAKRKIRGLTPSAAKDRGGLKLLLLPLAIVAVIGALVAARSTS